ncbi:anaerobic coproporphyrinogen III oxidase [Halospina denitrificans]|uniref:Heme chaperone HemW n=1 Tax=Halospina denitrificans TaxID=332522 RepID=A0A4R7K0N2_9GAMM|nr:radical SAM family heme chaperone HemW [Halospina denitrificans]TDT44392.1 anaerobic coproporphyrinogen III oxidase [Halospina denitrificans]
MTHASEGLQAPPLGLYLHTPWCVRKCPYCDFNSHTAPTTIPENDYLSALIEDLDADRDELDGRPLQSLFIGGGTPSLMSASFYERFLDALSRRVDLSQLDEITLEANPGTVEEARFRDFRRVGINRLSLGVQSFDPGHLTRLGRIHDDSDARRGVTTAMDAGFDRINLDLMHGLPGQTPEQAVSDLETALAFNTGHVSWYQLTIEPNTAFYSDPPPLPDDDTLASIQEQGEAVLYGAGLQRYEISAWGRPGEECRHNLNYWRFGDYLALGAGAHGKVTRSGSGRVRRYWKTRQPGDYINRIGSRTAGRSELEAQDLVLEFMLNALRLSEGVPASFFQARTGLPLSRIEDQLRQLRAHGLLADTPDQLVATERGRCYLNEVLEAFVP